MWVNRCEGGGRNRALLFVIAVCLILLLLGGLGAAGLLDGEGGATDVTTTYTLSPVTEQWEKSVVTLVLPDNGDGTTPKGSNTLIIRIDENNPVKQIIIKEALVITGVTEPLFEIAGHDTGGSGTLRIGELTFKTVDAEELEIHDTKANRVNMSNVVAKDNELDVNIETVNVVRVGRGGATSLFLGKTRGDIFGQVKDFDLDDTVVIPVTEKETGIRVDRIRILGPSSGTGHLERLVFAHSSVFGKIEIHDVEIDEINLTDVSLDDS